MKKEFLIV